MIKYYKVLKSGEAKDGGNFDYKPYFPKGKRKGKWTPQIKDCGVCRSGYHLTTKFVNWVSGGNQVWLAEPKRIIEREGNKIVCDSIRLIRLVKTNIGESNSGLCNSGSSNSGDRNSGDRNSGDNNSGGRNSGDRNSGGRNSGNCNSGGRNSGDWNSGDRNSGDWNSGYRNSGFSNSGFRNSGGSNSGDSNSGDWNVCDHETGSFNTKQGLIIRVFNKNCKRSVWEKAIKPRFIYFKLTNWVSYTEKEMKKDEKKRLIKGYLKTINYKEAFKQSFNQASKEDIKLLLDLPNFNYKVFAKLSGISKEMIKDKLK